MPQTVLDISHQIPPSGISQAACCPWQPDDHNTTHAKVSKHEANSQNKKNVVDFRRDGNVISCAILSFYNRDQTETRIEELFIGLSLCFQANTIIKLYLVASVTALTFLTLQEKTTGTVSTCIRCLTKKLVALTLTPFL